ncbi:MAG TPA: sarcosine oxidase [Gammaproteobacteria bacterium]|nr:sarcosine oxidase [Gammaproteobacteria bacterium]|tara:strand:+ start:627 stop:944 length:318 start_codon:yes stop_codon:yes gene_type:complete
MSTDSISRLGDPCTDPTVTDGLVKFRFDGQEFQGYVGESIAAALIAAGIYATKLSPSGTPRGYLCGMGVCWECVVRINGVTTERACRQLIEDGMIVETVTAAKNR